MIPTLCKHIKILRWQGHVADSSFGSGYVLTTANRDHRVHLLSSFEQGDDVDTGAGEIVSSSYRRGFLGGGYGYEFG